MTILWSAIGCPIFYFIITPLFFEPIVSMWKSNNWFRIVPLYSGFACSLFCVALFMTWVRRFPYSNRYEVLISSSLSANALLLILLAATRQFYSGTVLCTFAVFQIIWLGIDVFYRIRFREYRFAVFPTNVHIKSEDFPEYKITFIYDKLEMTQGWIDAVIVENEDLLDEEWLERLAYCHARNITIIPLVVFLENAWGRIPLDIMPVTPDVGRAYSNYYLSMKTVSDKAIALIGLIVLSPALLLIAILVKATSRGPVLFKQERIGFAGKKFVMYKFRTMRQADVPDNASTTSAAAANITLFGAFLRRTHLDELPQLFNVLKGDMTIVGPRPETPALTKYYKENIPFYASRTKVSQGVVGWALIHQGNVSGLEDTRIKLSYDIYYIKHASFFLDMYIIFKSVWLMLFGIEKVKSPHELGWFGKQGS